MKRFAKPLSAALVLCLLGAAGGASAITRDEVIVRAKAFSYHPWRCAQKNLTASCDPSYQSVYTPGDYVGLPYDWGGYMTTFEFDQQIDQGYGAGSYSSDGELACTAGLDCSGFVSKCWDAGHWSTSTLHNVSAEIDASEMRAGDVFNKFEYHVVLFSHELANGMPVFYEAVGYNTHINASTGYAWVSGYTPRRYEDIQGMTAGDPGGTITNPIVIPSLPYQDDRDTTASASDVFDGCGADPTKPESGPEYVYRVTLTQPGILTATVSDDVGVDIDIHLSTSANTSDCVARDDKTISVPVDCGTYYIIADTYGTGMEYAGDYHLAVQLAPSGQACGGGPPGYDPSGNLGDPCAFSGHENLPFCNENLGSEVCIYTSGTSPVSFCSKACAGQGDCAAFPGGCCEDIGQNEFYCLTSTVCTPPQQDAGAPDSNVGADAAGQDSGAPDGQTPPADGGGGQTGEDGSVGVDGAAGEDSAVSPGEDGGLDGGDSPGSTVPAAATGEDGGCGCRAAGDARSGAWWAVVVAGLWVVGRGRRRRRGG